ncbi:MAG TPA: signal peptidase I [Dehalococcoidia bacterium]|nr:signal peptidase I [Dehalococcoidia bacterium]
MSSSDRGRITQLLASAPLKALLQEALERGGYIRARASGCSMHPFIRDNDILHVEPARASQLKLGDVILFCDSQGKYITHRLVKKGTENGRVLLTTKGDNTAFCDLPIPATEMMGRVVEIERNGRCLRLDRGAGRMFNSLVYRLSPWKPWRFSWLRWLARHPWRWMGRLIW